MAKLSLEKHLERARAKRNPKTWVRDPVQCRAAVNERWRRWRQMKAMEKIACFKTTPMIDYKKYGEWLEKRKVLENNAPKAKRGKK